LGVRGPKSKIKEKQLCRGVHGELTAKKMARFIEKQKGRSNLKFVRDRQTDRQTDGRRYRQTESTTKNRLLG